MADILGPRAVFLGFGKPLEVAALVRWMVYGRLVDPFHEFLVQRCEGENDAEAAGYQR